MSAEQVAIFVVVEAIVAALVSIAIPDTVEKQATVAADCLFDMACETPTPAAGPDDGPAP